MTETGAWPRMAVGVAILVAGGLLIAWGVTSHLGTPPQHAAAAAAAPPASPPADPVDLVQIATSELQACPESTAPQVPDGAKATSAQMAAAHAAFQAYDTAINNYTKCVDAAVGRIAAQYKGSASAADIASLQAFGSNAHNTAIDQEQAVANQLNTEIRAFKARRPRA